jgi:SAM-dependent methyltransferase
LDAKTYLEKNRVAWNQVTPLHQAAQEGIVGQLLDADQLLLNPALKRELDRIGVGGKNVFQPCCNNGRELLSLKKMGAERCVGFDISESFVSVAADLSAASRLSAEFVCSDVYSIPDRYANAFDLALITAGTLMWMPDLPAFFEKIAGMLVSGGAVLIHEIHPVLLMLAENNTEHAFEIKYPYFSGGAREWLDGLDYLRKTEYQAEPHYTFEPTLSQIFTAVLQNKLSVTRFEELNMDISGLFGHLDEQEPSMPKSFVLEATKPRRDDGEPHAYRRSR